MTCATLIVSDDPGTTNDKKPKIYVLFDTDYLHVAHWVAFGIEEEGIPFEIQEGCDDVEAEALKLMDKSIPGVTVAITEEGMGVYYKYFKERKAFLHYPDISPENARKAGKNAAKIVKNKPLIL